MIGCAIYSLTEILTNTLKPGLISPDDERHKLAVTTKNISFWKKNK